MKAIVYNPDKVKPVYENWPKPTIGAHEVIVRIHAASLNNRDLNMTNPEMKSKFIYGSDGAGTIEQVGASVTEWVPGDEVIINPLIACLQCPRCLAGDHELCEHGAVLGGHLWNGTFGEFVKVPSTNLVSKPAHLDFQQAAALPLAIGTAWRSLFTLAKIKPGETLLIQGIGDGVTILCLQIANAMGAKVIVTSDLHEKLDPAIKMGAVAGINDKEENVAEKVYELTDGHGADVIVSSGGKVLNTAISSAAKKGRLIHFAYLGGELPAFDIDTFMFKQLSLYGSARHNFTEFEEAMNFINQTKLVPVIAGTYPMDEIEKAFGLMELSLKFGKIVLTI